VRVIAETSEAAHQDLGPKLAAPSIGKTLAGYLALVLPPSVILVDTAIAALGGWRVESRLDLAGLLAAGVLLAALTVALLLPMGRQLFGRRFAQLILLSLSCCATWGIAESALGPILAKVSDPFHGRRPGTKVVYHPTPGVMRDVGPEANVSYNAWGVRGREVPARDAAYRILCLGGSTTACTYLDDNKTWPQLLEADLHSDDPAQAFWVGNAGLPSLRTAEHLRFLENTPIINEIDCLVVQAGINDFMSALTGPNPSPPLWSHSRIWQLARALWRQWANPGTVVEDGAATVYVRRRALRQAAEIETAPPSLEAGLEDFAANVQQVIDVCRQHQLRVVFTTQPVLWRDDLDEQDRALLWFGHLPDGRYLSVEQLHAGMDRYNDRLRQVCRENKIDLIDLSSLDGNSAVFYDDCHFTETGAREVARIVADWFIAHPASAIEEPAK